MYTSFYLHSFLQGYRNFIDDFLTNTNIILKQLVTGSLSDYYDYSAKV